MSCECPDQKLKRQLLGTWIVPECNLSSFIYVGTEERAINVQTQNVWVIEDVTDRYFRGKSYYSLNGIPISVLNLVGSITPSGKVIVDFFTPMGSGQSIGTYERRREYDCHNIFEIQSTETILIRECQCCHFGIPVGFPINFSHWTKMIKVHPCDCLYKILPGVGISVSEYIAQFDQLPEFVGVVG